MGCFSWVRSASGTGVDALLLHDPLYLRVAQPRLAKIGNARIASRRLILRRRAEAQHVRVMRPLEERRVVEVPADASTQTYSRGWSFLSTDATSQEHALGATAYTLAVEPFASSRGELHGDQEDLYWQKGA